MKRKVARLIQTACMWTGVIQTILGAAGCADNPEWAVGRFVTAAIAAGFSAFIGWAIAVRDDRENSREEAKIIRRAFKDYDGRDEDAIRKNIGIRIPF